MRWIFAAAGLVTSMPLHAQGPVAVDAAVFVERSGERGLRIEPAERLMRGDRVVTVLSWQAPPSASYTITSAIPAGLALESISRLDLQVSTDGGRRWQPLADGEPLPRGVTHLRWQTERGDRQLSYRAIVR